ncbi:MAG: energy transducer TonB [Rhodothermales bacterium]|nr:energy transducer TonB [Rhodothermales bacterium]
MALADLGQAAWLPLWKPIIVWTLLAAALLVVLQVMRRRDWQLQMDARLAILVALPLTLILAQIVPGLPAPVPEPMPAFVAGEVAPSPAPELPAQAAPAPPRQDPLHLALGLLTAACLLLSLFGMTRFAVSAIRLGACIRHALPDRQRSFNSGRLVVVSPQAAGPFAFGLRSPVVVLPASFPYPEEAIAHEDEHIRSGDLFRAATAGLIKAVFFFHPLAHVLDRQLRALCELSCDGRLLTRQAVSRGRYGRALLAAAGTAPAGDLVVPMSSFADLRKRLDQCSRAARQSRPATALGLGALVLLVSGLAGGCLGAPAEPAVVPGLAERLALPVSSSSERFRTTDQVPELPGGVDSLNRTLVYPSDACPSRYGGIVVVEFILDPDGFVHNPETRFGLTEGCDAEAIRAVKESRWLPGVVDGERVWTELSIPVRLLPPREAKSSEAVTRDLRRALLPLDDTWTIDHYSSVAEIKRTWLPVFTGPPFEPEYLEGLARINKADAIVVGRVEDLGRAMQTTADSASMAIVYTDHQFDRYVIMRAGARADTSIVELEPAASTWHAQLTFLLPLAVSIQIDDADGTTVRFEPESSRQPLRTTVSGDLAVTVSGPDGSIVRLHKVEQVYLEEVGRD